QPHAFGAVLARGQPSLRSIGMCSFVAGCTTLSLVAPGGTVVHCRDPAWQRAAAMHLIRSGGTMVPTGWRSVMWRATFGALLAVTAGILSPPVAGAGAGGNGEFIIRCPMTGEVQPVDPILAPGRSAAHVHMFFGN